MLSQGKEHCSTLLQKKEGWTAHRPFSLSPPAALGRLQGTFPCRSTPLELFSWETQGVHASGSPQPVLPPQAGSSHQFAWQREAQGAWRSQFPLRFRRSTQWVYRSKKHKLPPLLLCQAVSQSSLQEMAYFFLIFFNSASFSMPFPLLLQLLWLHLLKWSTLANAITDIHPFHPCKLFIIVSLASA